MSENEVVDSLTIRFRSLAATWAGIPLSEFRNANRVFRDLHSVAMGMKSTEEGRAALETLAQSSDPAVAVVAASECLSWHSPTALLVLKSIAGGSDLLAGSAKQTLKSYEEGSLNMDW